MIEVVEIGLGKSIFDGLENPKEAPSMPKELGPLSAGEGVILREMMERREGLTTTECHGWRYAACRDLVTRGVLVRIYSSRCAPDIDDTYALTPDWPARIWTTTAQDLEETW